jgi:outer membrane lipopolysaccharide assembly protein LptE/RlpB
MRQVTHTPFVVCMLATGTISLLAACKFHLTGQRLLVARHQIRMSIGHLKALAEVWLQAERSLSEIQTIAREVLGQQITQQKQMQPNDGLNKLDAEEQASGTMNDLYQNPISDYLPQHSMEGLQAYFDLGDFCADQPWVAEY